MDCGFPRSRLYHPISTQDVPGLEAGVTHGIAQLVEWAGARVLKPVLFQERTKPERTSMTRADDEAVFMTDEYRFGIRYRCNSGFGFWQTAFCSKKPLNDPNFNAAYDAMTAFKADGGRPLGIKPTLLVVPTNLRTAAAEVVQVARRTDGSDNPNAGIVDVLVTPWLN